MKSHSTSHAEWQSNTEGSGLFRLHKVDLSLPGYFEDLETAAIDTQSFATCVKASSDTPLGESDAESTFHLWLPLWAHL